MLLPSTWWAAVAVPQRKLAGNVKRSVAIATVPRRRKIPDATGKAAVSPTQVFEPRARNAIIAVPYSIQDVVWAVKSENPHRGHNGGCQGNGLRRAGAGD